MFDWNHDGKLGGFNTFMDFMVFNEVMNGGHKMQKRKETEPKHSWIDELEELDAMEDENE